MCGAHRKEDSTSGPPLGLRTYALGHAMKMESFTFIFFILNPRSDVTMTVLYYPHKISLSLFYAKQYF